MRLLLTSSIAVIVTLSSVAAATAATAAVEASARGGLYVNYLAGEGERNELRATAEGTTLQLSDRVPITPGRSCVSVTATSVRCVGLFPPSSVPAEPLGVYAELRDGDDSVVGSSNDDILQGGEGDDNLDGAEGFDVLDGGTGDDLLRNRQSRDSLQGGGGDGDRFLLDPRLPLGDPNRFAASPAGPEVACGGDGTVEHPRGQVLLYCPHVRLGPGSTIAAKPRFTSTGAEFKVQCPSVPGAGPGRCTGRITVGSRRRGEQRFSIRSGRTTTVTVPLRAGRSQLGRYGFVVSANARYANRTVSLRGAWTIRLGLTV